MEKYTNANDWLCYSRRTWYTYFHRATLRTKTWLGSPRTCWVESRRSPTCSSSSPLCEISRPNPGLQLFTWRPVERFSRMWHEAQELTASRQRSDTIGRSQLYRANRSEREEFPSSLSFSPVHRSTLVTINGDTNRVAEVARRTSSEAYRVTGMWL